MRSGARASVAGSANWLASSGPQSTPPPGAVASIPVTLAAAAFSAVATASAFVLSFSQMSGPVSALKSARPGAMLFTMLTIPAVPNRDSFEGSIGELPCFAETTTSVDSSRPS